LSWLLTSDESRINASLRLATKRYEQVDSAEPGVRRLETNLNDEPLKLVRLTRLMELTEGRSSLVVGLADGPVAQDHPGLGSTNIRDITVDGSARCANVNSVACTHGTFIAGILSGNRRSAAPAICPGCTLLVRSIFSETDEPGEIVPSASPRELALGILDLVNAGACVINLSVAIVRTTRGQVELQHALDHAARKGAVIVAAAGNQGEIGSSVITRHPWVIPVVAYDLTGRFMTISNVGASIGKRGVGAPGEGVTSLRAAGGSLTMGGTSVAAPFVTGTVALLWSVFPRASAAEIKLAVSGAALRRSVLPHLLDAELARQILAT
jgi:subtilisin family serine protease